MGPCVCSHVEDTAGHETFGPEALLAYLLRLESEHLELILEFAGVLLRQYPALGRKVKGPRITRS